MSQSSESDTEDRNESLDAREVVVLTDKEIIEARNKYIYLF